MSIKSEIKALMDKIDEINFAYLNDPEFIEISKKYHAKMDELSAKAWSAREPLWAKIDELQKQLETEGKAIPKSILDFIDRIKAGTDYGPHALKVRWHSEDGRFFILTFPGHSCWSGRGNTRYEATEHFLFDISQADLSSHGSILKHGCTIESVEGKLSKETIKQWKEMAATLANKS